MRFDQAVTSVLLLFVLGVRQALALDYTSLTSYDGMCADAQDQVLPFFNYLLSEEEANSATLTQDGLDNCLSAFGDHALVGYSIYRVGASAPYTYWLLCYLATSADASDVAGSIPGYSLVSTTGVYPVTKGVPSVYHTDVVSTCYAVPYSLCSAKVVAAVDRTYALTWKKQAFATATEAYGIAAAVASALTLSSDVRFGVVDLDHYTISWRVDVDSEDATDAAAVALALASPNLDAGAHSRVTEFKKLVQGSGQLASADVPSYVLLISDGQLIKPRNWRRYANMKRRVVQRLGANAPKWICYRLLRASNSDFLDAICDSTYYEGMDGKTLTQIAADISTEICTAPV